MEYAEKVEKYGGDVEAEATALGLVSKPVDASGYLFVELPDDPAGPRLRVNFTTYKLAIRYGESDRRLEDLARVLMTRWGDEVAEVRNGLGD